MADGLTRDIHASADIADFEDPQIPQFGGNLVLRMELLGIMI